VEHLVYASSSSVYGANTTMPFSVHHTVDHPLSLYAASKKANELMAHTYSHLYQLPTTGLRFFTVYGPWGRPDMSPMLFSGKMLKGEPIDVFNGGHHRRDFTYVDDVVEGVVRSARLAPSADATWDELHPDPASSRAPFRIYNIGNSAPVELLQFIRLLEQALGVTARMNMLPMQPGDVQDTLADVTDLERAIGYRPQVSIEQGVERFVAWYRDYFKIT
jgi:UDP-glucuronate 4-epimerase